MTTTSDIACNSGSYDHTAGKLNQGLASRQSFSPVPPVSTDDEKQRQSDGRKRQARKADLRKTSGEGRKTAQAHILVYRFGLAVRYQQGEQCIILL
jgi:hypothetical protein